MRSVLVSALVGGLQAELGCKRRHRGCKGADEKSLGNSYEWNDKWDGSDGKSTYEQCFDECELAKNAGCVGFLADDMSVCTLVNELCEPEGGQTDDDWDNLAFFAMVDCVEDDGTTPLVAGECGSNNWSGYLNSNKDVQFGDTEKLENIYNKPKGWLNRMIDRYAICTSEDMVTGLKATVIDGANAVLYKDAGEAKTTDKEVTFSVENGLKCENNDQDDNQCKNYGLAMCCKTQSQWNEWNAWAACSKKCGGGLQTRERSCDNSIKDTKCPGEGEFESAVKQTKDCNKQPCIMTNVERYKNEWYNKCTLSGDPHIKTFDNIWVDVMQYGETYHLVNAYKGGSQTPVFIVKVKTTGTTPRQNDPRAGFERFIINFNNGLEIMTENNNAKWRSGNGAWSDMPPMTKVYSNIRVNYNKKGNRGFMEFPEYELYVEFQSWYGKVLVHSNSDYEYKGYCGTRDYDPDNELTVPLNRDIYGSTAHVYSAKVCQGKKPRGLPFFQCGKLDGNFGRKRRDSDESHRHRRDAANCPGAADPAAECQAIVDTFPNCKEKMPAEEISGFMDTCKVDMCFDNGADAKKQMMDQFLGTCGDASAKSGEQIETDCARMAEIQKQLTGKEPVCPEGKIFDGCATECSYMTCEDAVKNNDEWEPIDKCEDNGKQEAGCVCAKNMFLLNGNCVVFDKCMEKGWSEWGDWGPCDDTCAVGTEGGKKERSRFHMETGEVETENGDCAKECTQPNSAFTVLSAGTCESGEWEDWTQEDVVPEACAVGLAAKEGKIDGEGTTKNFVTWGLNEAFACNDDDQIRGFQCGNTEFRHCCQTGPCPAGEELGSDEETCYNIEVTKEKCPSAECWTYEEDTCVLKSACKTYLECTPELMDFRFSFDQLIGAENTHDQNPDVEGCPLQDSDAKMTIDEEEVDVEGVDKMWKYEPGTCDSTVSRVKDDNDVEWIEVKKTLVYGDSPDATQKVQDTVVYLQDSATIAIEFVCRYPATVTLTTDQITVKSSDTSVEGKLLAKVGSWSSALAMDFKDEEGNNLADDFVGVLGATLRVSVAWSVFESEIGKKLNWYIPYCEVQGLLEDGEVDDSKKMSIIKNMCFAQIFEAKPISDSQMNTADYRFSFQTFSFDAAGEKKQQVSCNVNFCIVGDECDAIKPAEMVCDADNIFDWKKAADIE